MISSTFGLAVDLPSGPGRKCEKNLETEAVGALRPGSDESVLAHAWGVFQKEGFITVVAPYLHVD